MDAEGGLEVVRVVAAHRADEADVVHAFADVGEQVADFGAAFAAGWAVANLLDLGPYGVHIMQGLFFLCGLAVMVAFVQSAQRVEPFTTR